MIKMMIDDNLWDDNDYDCDDDDVQEGNLYDDSPLIVCYSFDDIGTENEMIVTNSWTTSLNSIE